MKIIDLTQTLSSGMKVYEGDPEVKIKKVHAFKKEGWQLRLLSLGSHTGSHVDAPSHMDIKGKTIEEIPIERFIGKAKLVGINDVFPKEIGLAFSKGKITLNLFEKILTSKPPFVIVGNIAKLEVEVEKKLLKRGIITFTDLINMDKLP